MIGEITSQKCCLLDENVVINSDSFLLLIMCAGIGTYFIGFILSDYVFRICARGRNEAQGDLIVARAIN